MKVNGILSSPLRGTRVGLFFLISILFVSCGSKQTESSESIDEEVNELVETNEYKENGLNKLKAVSQSLDTEAGYNINLSLAPDERLPRVPNENFGSYCDNRATVVVTQGADTLLVRQLVKADFEDYIDKSLSDFAVFDALTLTQSAAKAVTFEASISVPHSDEQAVVAVTLGLADGQVSMQRVTTANDSFADEEEVED